MWQLLVRGGMCATIRQWVWVWGVRDHVTVGAGGTGPCDSGYGGYGTMRPRSSEGVGCARPSSRGYELRKILARVGLGGSRFLKHI
eukprot:1178483-Prorocentrum_minimum.AAC.4